MTQNKFPDYIMEYLRQREGLERDDTSRDALINGLSPAEAFREVVAWKLGFRDSADIIAEWMHDCGAKLEDFIE